MPTSDALSIFPLFKGTGTAALAALASDMRERSFSPGQVIALEGDACDEVCFVHRGLVRIRQLSLEGREHVLTYLGPGGCFNLVAALDGGAHLGSVDALTTAGVYALPCARLRDLMMQHADLSLTIARHLARESRRLSQMVKELALHPVRARLARFLLDFAEEAPSGRRWTQDMIAAHIGTVRDVVGRVLRSMEADGMIRRERGRLVVMDREAMQREAAVE